MKNCHPFSFSSTNSASFFKVRSEPAFGTRILLVCALCLFQVFHSRAASSHEEMESLLCKATVRVVILEGKEIAGHGTGFLISAQGHIATNRHVAVDGGNFGVMYSDRHSFWLRQAEVVGRSPDRDLAILKIDPIEGMRPLVVFDGGAVTLQNVTACGFPGVVDTMTWVTGEGIALGESGKGRFLTESAKADFVPMITDGKVNKAVVIEGSPVLLHSAKLSGGNSGGALVDADGRIVGVNTAIVASDGDYAISIQASELLSLAKALEVPLATSTAKASTPGAMNKTQTALFVAIGLFCVLLFLLVLRKPRTVMVDAMSRMVSRRGNQGHPGPARVAERQPQNTRNGVMRLRGRDLQGQSYDVTFNRGDFHRSGGRLILGRKHELCQLVISHDSVSRQHAVLLLQGDVVMVEDRNSGNGTKVNGRELPVGSPAIPLRAGDRLTLGEVEMVFEEMP